ncbi:MAG TPA: DUF1345 domain-containing protein [Pseudomonadales bacterium]|nr:DUF1345 domain-containing protein [Pseudomonadales bacterium]
MTSDRHPHPALPHRFLLVRQVRARPRLLLSILFAAVIYCFLSTDLVSQPTTRLLLTWNGGVCLYLLLAGIMIIKSSHEHIHSYALAQDEGKLVVLTSVILATIACLAAIFADLVTVSALHGKLKYAHIILAVMTVASSWCFIHLMFSFNYAHDFYINKNQGFDGGLQFPGTENPDYADFLYFACIIGTSGQTADVSFSSQSMRRIGMIHCVLAYAFNTTVLALTINIASGLL